MSSSITTTPLTGAGTNRPQKERERRSREMAAYKNLRQALDAADPKSFWRMEKVDIAEGAVVLIQKLTGGSTRQKPIVCEDKNEKEDEKLSRVEVEKRRRARESTAIKNLKDELITHSKAHSRTEKIDVIYAATNFIKTLSNNERGSSSSHSEGTASPECTDTTTDSSSPDTIAATSRRQSPVNPNYICSVTPIDPFTAQHMLLASMMQPLSFLPFSFPPVFQAQVFGFDNTNVTEPVAKKQKTAIWRPYQ